MTRSGRFCLCLVLLTLACAGPEREATGGLAGAARDEKTSSFGVYAGYSEARFDEWVRTSHYITARDGTRLAIDVVRPATDGVAVDEPFPVVWTHSRYHRSPASLVADGRRAAAQDERGAGGEEHDAGQAAASSEVAGTSEASVPTISYVDVSPTLQRLVRHGYVFVAVGVRGSGASFGRYEGLFSPAETRDSYDVIDWLAKQAWCDGNVGMWGGSYLGITQYMAASTGHPALKAIFPNVALFDFYEVLYPGGIYRDDLIEQWGVLTRNLDVNIPAPVVDEDDDGALLAAAVQEHRDNWDVIEELQVARYRDHDSPSFAYERHNPAEFLEAINKSGVAAYHWGGWYDVFALDEFLWFANYEGPQKIAIGPWSHTAQGQPSATERQQLEAVEHHRWFDYWLKGIDNGVMDEPPVNYAIMDDAPTWEWTAAQAWPPSATSARRLYFAAGPSGSVGSVNDGLLVDDGPESAGHDEYVVNPATTTGTASRWDNAVGQGAMAYPDMATHDALSLTYTTSPLTEDLVVVGHPVVTLHVTSSSGDGDFYVLLEEVDGNGVSSYITEGLLRASQRTPAQAPWNNLGLPFQRCLSADARPMPDGPAELVFDLIPTAQIFNAGHRLRVTVSGADADNTEPGPGGESPTFHVYRSPAHASSISLPLAVAE